MKEIELTQGKVAIVDDEDFEYISQWKWCYTINQKSRSGYAIRRPGILMHRVINKTPPGMQTDHINGNGLDNRKENLRSCTRTQNKANVKMNRNNKSGYKGVSREKKRKTWRAHIRIGGKGRALGRFDILEEAARAYDRAAREKFGEFARLNFPEGEPG